MTYTYVILDVDAAVYRQVRRLLEEAGYEHAFHCDLDGVEVIDMHGIALRGGIADCSLCGRPYSEHEQECPH